MPDSVDVEVVAEEVGFLPSAVLSFEEPRMLKAESFESEAMIQDWNRGKRFLWMYLCLCLSNLVL